MVDPFNPEKFDPNPFLMRVRTGEYNENDITVLTDQFRASDLSVIVKTLMIAVEILAAKKKPE